MKGGQIGVRFQTKERTLICYERVSVYTLPAQTMLQVLAQRQHSGQLEAEIPGRERGEIYRAVIFLEKGKIRSCALIDRSGRVVQEGQAVLQTLFRAGDLTWTVSAAQPPLPSQPTPMSPSMPGMPFQPMPTSPSMPAAPFPGPPPAPAPFAGYAGAPRPVRLLNQPGSGWPRRWTQVFLLVDGGRDSQQIALVLGLSTQEVVQILQELLAVGAIGWR